jgi:hypothetical protein
MELHWYNPGLAGASPASQASASQHTASGAVAAAAGGGAGAAASPPAVQPHADPQQPPQQDNNRVGRSSNSSSSGGGGWQQQAAVNGRAPAAGLLNNVAGVPGEPSSPALHPPALATLACLAAARPGMPAPRPRVH